MPARTREVTLIGRAARAPDLVIMGSHCVALDAVLGALAEQGFAARTIAVGSMGGVAAAERGECDLAPVHLIDPATGIYNQHLLRPGSRWCAGWQRMQGFVFRPGDARFDGKHRAGGARRPRSPIRHCLMVNRNAGAGTRILIDQLLGRRAARRATPTSRGRTTRSRPRSRRAAPTGASRSSRWRGLYGLGFLPHRAGALRFPAGRDARREPAPAVQALLSAGAARRSRARHRASGRSACVPR